MAFDGITVSNIAFELNNKLAGGRITKIAQPEKDELFLTIKGSERKTYRLLVSANASLPLVYFASDNKPSPMTAPNFCMLLRKNLSGARIISIYQVRMERVIFFELEHLNELGDLCHKYLIAELMGKHSNIILCEKKADDKLIIIDSIKRVNSFVSSVREVLPGREYFIPDTMHKSNPLSMDISVMKDITDKSCSIQKAIYTSLVGFSPIAAAEICFRAGIDADISANMLTADNKVSLYNELTAFIESVKNHEYHPNIIFENNRPLEFASFNLSIYTNCDTRQYESVCEMLETFYSRKNVHTRIKQRSADLRRIVSTALERNRKKLDLQLKQYKDTDKREKYKVYGELLTTYGYSASKGDKSIICNNYYTGEDITIPLDKDLNPIDNAKKYFDKYSKLKRTYEALTTQIAETKNNIMHLESIGNALDIADSLGDLNSIKEELIAAGYIKKGCNNRKKQQKCAASLPLHYVSGDGYDIYVGKNNFQNDELTFTNQGPKDWWFHVKGTAGSHVVLRSKGVEIPDRTFEEAAALAAFYSKKRDEGKVEVDYTELKNVKKPKGSNPGFVVYYTNYSMVATTDISSIKEITD